MLNQLAPVGVQVCCRNELHDVAGFRLRPRYRARWQLDDGERPNAERDPPRDERRISLEHPAISRDKDHVDREAHEKGVNRAAGRDDERRTLVKRIAPEESTAAAGGVDRELDLARDDSATAGVLKSVRMLRIAEDRGKK